MIQATVIGRIGNEPTLAHGANDTDFVKLRVASSYKDKDGEKTTWVGGTLFNKRAKALIPYLNKGDQIALHGTLYTREYEGKTQVEMQLSDVTLIGGKKKEKGDDLNGDASDDFK